MKKLFTLTALLFFIGLTASAQIFTIGPKLGISNTTLSLKDNIDDYESGEAKYSYHGGLFARVKITGFYVQPEIYFNSVNGEYFDSSSGTQQTVEFNRNKIDMPILFGWKMGPLRINAGPVASFNLDDEVDTSSSNSAISEYKSAVFAYQAGIGVDISKVIIDLRYEGNLSNQAILGNDEGKVRVNQVMLSVGLKLL